MAVELDVAMSTFARSMNALITGDPQTPDIDNLAHAVAVAGEGVGANALSGNSSCS